MTYLIKYFLSAFLVLASFTSILFADQPDKRLHECLYSTVRVERVDDGGGSGVIVRSVKDGDKYHNAVITCAHVVRYDTSYIIKVPFYKDWSTLDHWKTYPAKVYAANPDKDLAIMLFESDEKMHVSSIDFDCKLYIGSSIFHFGCGQGPEPRLDEGKITSLSAPGKDVVRYRTNMMIVPGDSGGPVFHKHKVIGFAQSIRVMRFNDEPLPLFNISMMMPAGHLKSWDQDSNNVLGFVYNTKRRLPVLPYTTLKLEGYVLVDPPVD